MRSSKLFAGLILACGFGTWWLSPLAQAQSGVPVPGGSGGQVSAPVPGALGSAAAVQIPSAYRQLPISAADAQTRLAELKIMLEQSPAKSVQDSIYQYCDWLADMADAHNKLANSFSKLDATKSQSESERQAAHKFQQLRYQALLLKAKLLIKECRFPEALAPLVEIVVAEPRSATGQQAYQQLKEIGFAEEPAGQTDAKANTGGSKPSTSATPTARSLTPLSNPAVKNGNPPPVPGKTTAASPAQKGAALPVKNVPATAANAAASPSVATTVMRVAARSAEKATAAMPTRHPTVWMSGTPFGDGGRSE